MKSIPVSAAASVLLLVTGCSPARPSAEFTRKVSLADHIIVTNRALHVTRTLTGDDFRAITMAVTNAVEDKHNYDSIWDCEIQFFSGTNLLTTVNLAYRTFFAGSNHYVDSSGVL